MPRKSQIPSLTRPSTEPEVVSTIVTASLSSFSGWIWPLYGHIQRKNAEVMDYALLGRNCDRGLAFGVDVALAVHVDGDVADDRAREREGGDVVVADGEAAGVATDRQTGPGQGEAVGR